MTFPDTVEEFMEQYKITDTEQVYTNGTELVPIFRMNQWFENHKDAKDINVPARDCISRQQAIEALDKRFDNIPMDQTAEILMLRKDLRNLPSVQPDYTKMKQEFLRMAGYIDVLLECSDEQKETLLGFISRMSEFMPWTQED